MGEVLTPEMLTLTSIVSVKIQSCVTRYEDEDRKKKKCVALRGPAAAAAAASSSTRSIRRLPPPPSPPPLLLQAAASAAAAAVRAPRSAVNNADYPSVRPTASTPARSLARASTGTRPS